MERINNFNYEENRGDYPFIHSQEPFPKVVQNNGVEKGAKEDIPASMNGAQKPLVSQKTQ